MNSIPTGAKISIAETAHEVYGFAGDTEAMKADRLYQELVDLAEKLNIEVAEQNFRATGVNAVSGLCKVKGKSLFLIDKHKRMQKKIEILSEFLATMPIGNVHMLPAVRDHLSKYREADSLFSRDHDPREDGLL